jgi:hypothetical protein
LASLLRNKIAYAVSTGEITQERGGDCFLFVKIKCWKKAFGDAFLAGLKASAEFIIPYLVGGDPETKKAAWELAKTMFYITSGITAVIDIVAIYLDEDCKCGSETPTVVDPCAAPSAIGLFSISDCGPIQTAVVSGQMLSSVSLYSWTIQNGVAVDFPGVLTGINTTVPTLRIKQNNTNTPVTLSCFLTYSIFGCPLQSRQVVLDIPKLINSPGEVVIVGASLVTHGDPIPYRYLFNGSYKTGFNNNIISNSGASYHGTVTSPVGFALPYIDVVWNLPTTSYSSASVNATSKNTCSNATFSAWLSPITVQ